MDADLCLDDGGAVDVVDEHDSDETMVEKSYDSGKAAMCRKQHSLHGLLSGCALCAFGHGGLGMMVKVGRDCKSPDSTHAMFLSVWP